KAVYFITDEGFNIYSQSFGATDQDEDMVGSLILALQTFGKEVMSEKSLQTVGFGGGGEGGADTEGSQMILEQGTSVNAIAFVIFEKDIAETEELKLRRDLLKIVREVEVTYKEELTNPIFQKSAFTGLETLINTSFFRDMMSRIYQDSYAHFSEYLKYPTSLLFELTSRGDRTYTFYRDFPDFRKLLKSIALEKIDELITYLQERSSMISFQDCLERFEEKNGSEIFEILKYLTRKGVFDSYNFERFA
ncbi:MAG: hypothetical protein KAT16_11640, partial [Candidatus Heimdallarchaeota archaeon]|nr:hypothetical protein [Candidatus Heimdallarchaeota archaeon]